jgi:hypothetical protein
VLSFDVTCDDVQREHGDDMIENLQPVVVPVPTYIRVI